MESGLEFAAETPDSAGVGQLRVLRCGWCLIQVDQMLQSRSDEVTETRKYIFVSVGERCVEL